MKRELISLALDELEDRFISEAAVFDPGARQGPPERIVHMKSKRILTFALAAALLLALSAVAYAIGSSHAARQQALRGQLGVEQSGAAGYVEYAVGDEAAEGLVLLSAINDGVFQKVYVDVSPVSEEELAAFPGGLSFLWSVAGGEHGGIAMPQLADGQSLSDAEAIRDAVRAQAYDAETQTLTLVCWIDSALLEEIGAPVTLELAMFEGEREVRAFGSVPFTPTASETRYFDFGGLRWHDAETGRELELLGLELSPTGAVWKFRFEGDAALYAAMDQQELLAWGQVEARVCDAAELILADGTAFSTGAGESSPYENGCVNCYAAWSCTLDPRAVTRITLAGQTLWEQPGA